MMKTECNMAMVELKSALMVRMAEFEMLNKTLIEAIEKGSSEVTIEAIKAAIKDAEENVKTLRDWIEERRNKEQETNKVQYSFYDGIKKPTSTKSIKGEFGENKFFDSIKDDDSSDYYVVQSNRFLVRFGTTFDIRKDYVRSVDFMYNDKELVISIFNFIKDDKHPIIAELLARRFNDTSYEFPISIDYLDPSGAILYTERYHHCHIVNVERDGVDYTRDDTNRILLTISYSDVTYETSH